MNNPVIANALGRCTGVLVSLLLVSGGVSAELPSDPIPAVAELQTPYKDHWVFVHDLTLFEMVSEKIALVDADTREYLGQINASTLANFQISNRKPELYVAETFFSRGVRGERSDVVTVYDKKTLSPIAEIPLPAGKRSQLVIQKHAAALIDDDRLLLIFNFTPAASVQVVDIDAREVVAEHPIGGCALIYATGKRGFSSLCSKGTMISYALDENGGASSTYETRPFFNVDEDPLFAKPAIINGIAYFPTFKGRMQPIDLRAGKPVIMEAWSFVNGADARANYRPGGWQIIGEHDGDNEIYVLMHRDGYEGSHKDGGSEIWVLDPEKKKRVRKIELRNHGVSLEVTEDDKPLLLVINATFNVDVYDARRGTYKHTITDLGVSPYLMYTTNR